MRLTRLILVLGGVLLLLRPVEAGLLPVSEKEAKTHYERGMGYYKQAKYREAQQEFRLALSSSAEDVPSFPKLKIEQKNKQTKTQSRDKNPPKTSGYIIGEDDTLYISVWQNKDLDQEVVVRPDGMVSFPLAGEVQASGLTITEFKARLTKKLKEYIKYPDVSISVRKLGGKKVIILGEVASPGVYAVSGKSSLLEAIALARGFTRDAVVSSVIVIRGGFKRPKGMRLNLNRAILKADISQNVILQPEDIIYVPKKFIANVNYFVTQTVGALSQGASPYETYKNR